MNRILVIRGGAIGDFVLTLPAIKLLRDRFPCARLEILGYPHIIALAENRFYAEASRSIEDRPLARFFVKNAVLPFELTDYLGSFDLILSYVFDPDGIFETNLRRCAIKTLVAGPAKLTAQEHAARQLARPLEVLGLHLQDPAARLYPAEADRDFARGFLGDIVNPIFALHPGSGSKRKNWPIEQWKKLGDYLLARNWNVLVVSGEADEEQVQLLEDAWKKQPVRYAKNLPLPQLPALFENAFFLGHDSGISHVAAAMGAPCTLLFGPTDPAVWAPANKNVTVIQAPGGNLARLEIELVAASLRHLVPANASQTEAAPITS